MRRLEVRAGSLDDTLPVWHDAAMAADVKALDRALAERDRVIRAIRDHKAELRALGVEKLWLFGSLARGDVGRRSDVDVLISVPPDHKFSLLDLAGVQVELSELLARDTDVVIREDATPRFWQTIREDLIGVF
jgi:predicted nucleotidyltransferase